MPFVEVNVKREIEKRRQNNEQFKKEWDESRAEYRLIGEMISLRKQENITQKELAKLTGKTQQTISKIERRESIPTITAFNKLLNVLGYELKIVKRQLYRITGEKIWNGQMENAGVGGQIPKMNDIFAIMIKNGGNRFMRMENYSKC